MKVCKANGLAYFRGALGQEISEKLLVLAGHFGKLSTHFKYHYEVRWLIYTTNAIVGVERQLRKVTKAKSVFYTSTAC